MPSGLKKNKKEGSNINIYIYYKCINAVIFLKVSWLCSVKIVGTCVWSCEHNVNLIKQQSARSTTYIGIYLMVSYSRF